MIHLIRQPEGSALCGQACVAMVAGVSLERAIGVVGHQRGTHTRDIVRGLRCLKVVSSGKLRRISRARPVIPNRAIVAIVYYAMRPDGTRGQRYAHWLLSWDGVIYDPGEAWPERYVGWTMTSYLEIL